MVTTPWTSPPNGPAGASAASRSLFSTPEGAKSSAPGRTKLLCCRSAGAAQYRLKGSPTSSPVARTCSPRSPTTYTCRARRLRPSPPPAAAGSPSPRPGPPTAWSAPPTARPPHRLEISYRPASDVHVDLRGAGSCSRQVNNYALGNDLNTDHLLVCEVLTPGGNWSSYPPHKHDVHSEVERELEEIYYFDVRPGPDGPGFAFHRTYGTAERPIEISEEVRAGDVVLTPHGFHGPSMAAPGYDLYYLNVMAGPAADGTWLMTVDPAHHWIRGTWESQDVDS